MVFGQALRLPGDFLAHDQPEINPSYFTRQIKTFMAKIRPIAVKHNLSKYPTGMPFIFKDMSKCSHVFKLVKKVKPPLVRPYTGPHKVISRHKSGKYFKIEYKDKNKTVSIEHLKPFFFIPESFGQIVNTPKPIPAKEKSKTKPGKPIPWDCLPLHPELLDPPLNPQPRYIPSRKPRNISPPQPQNISSPKPQNPSPQQTQTRVIIPSPPQNPIPNTPKKPVTNTKRKKCIPNILRRSKKLNLNLKKINLLF